jgi:hypothetical protein
VNSLVLKVSSHEGKSSPRGSTSLLIGVDGEWVKWPYNEAFGFAAHVLHVPTTAMGRLPICQSVSDWAMDAVVLLRPPLMTREQFLHEVDRVVGTLMQEARASRGTICGHQFATDVHFLGAGAGMPNVTALRTAWRERKGGRRRFSIMDTRYDLQGRIRGQERLVDVCKRQRVYAVQPELRRTSLSALYRQYCASGEAHLAQQLAVINWRHALSSALLALADRTSCPVWGATCSVANCATDDYRLGYHPNTMIARLAKNHFSYVDSDRYSTSCLAAGSIRDWYLSPA